MEIEQQPRSSIIIVNVGIALLAIFIRSGGFVYLFWVAQLLVILSLSIINLFSGNKERAKTFFLALMSILATMLVVTLIFS